MRKILFSIWLLVIMGSATELHQLLRLPFMLEHFRHHKGQDSSLSLVDFLKIHYGMAHPDDRDDKDDEQLPFRSTAQINHLDTPLTCRSETIINPSYRIISTTGAIHDEGKPCQRAASVFHPPRC